MQDFYNLKELRRAALKNRTFPRKNNTPPVRFGIKKPQGNVKRPVAQVVFKPEVLNQLHWRAGDKVNVLYNDNAIIIERDNGGYWTVIKDANSANYMVMFSIIVGKYADRKETLSRTGVEYLAEDDTLLVRI